MIRKSLSYHFGAFKARLRGGLIFRIYHRICFKIEMYLIRRRLLRKGHSEVKVLQIMIRYSSIQTIRNQIATKQAIRSVYDMITEVSDLTGIPQWDLRALLQKDFHLDI